MRKLLMICPSYKRPDRIREMIDSFNSTKSNFTELFVYCSSNGLSGYKDSLKDIKYISDDKRYMTEILNHVFNINPNEQYYGFVHDDHIFRTNKWDEKMISNIDGIGVSYPNDLWPDSCVKWRHASCFIMSGEIPRCLGYILHPKFKHIGTDTSIRDLCEALGIYHYCSDVIVEHMHYNIGKADNDESYKYVYSDESCREGDKIYRWWKGEVLPKDAEKLSKLKQGLYV
jgi:hypothetical protein